MKNTTIAVINDHLASGAIIAAFTGTLTKLFPQRSGGEGDRAWTKRTGEMKDANGDKIDVDFWNREVPDSWKGKTLILQSVEGRKGTHGVAVFDDEYNGKTTRKLKVTATAEIAFADGDASEARQTARGDERPDTAPRSEKPASGAPATSGRPSGQLDLRAAILRRATVWNHCFDAAVAVAHSINARHEYAMVPAGIAGLATTLYIETMRGLCGDLSNVDPKSVDWSPAKGKTLKDHLSALDRQVMEHRAHQAPAPASTPTAPANPTRTAPEIPLEEQDEIPF